MSDPTSPDPNASPPRQASLSQVIAAVFWSFFGVRKGNAMARDTVTIKPVQVIVVGVAVAALIVATLLTIVLLLTR